MDMLNFFLKKTLDRENIIPPVLDAIPKYEKDKLL